MRNVRQKCVADKGRDGDRRTERGRVEKLILSKEEPAESWIKPKQPHAGSKKQRLDTGLFCKCTHRSEFRMLINKNNVIYHHH